MQYSHVVVSFNSLQEVNEYEKYFNQEIFIPAWNDMLVKVRSLESRAHEERACNLRECLSWQNLPRVLKIDRQIPPK